MFSNKFNQRMKDLYNKNYKTMMNEIIKDTHKNEKVFLGHGLEKSMSLKYLYYVN